MGKEEKGGTGKKAAAAAAAAVPPPSKPPPRCRTRRRHKLLPQYLPPCCPQRPPLVNTPSLGRRASDARRHGPRHAGRNRDTPVMAASESGREHAKTQGRAQGSWVALGSRPDVT